MPEKEVVFEGEVSRRPQVGLRSPLGCTERPYLLPHGNLLATCEVKALSFAGIDRRDLSSVLG